MDADLPRLNEYYYPGNELLAPNSLCNGFSRDNRRFQRFFKRRIWWEDRIIEIGCGSGDSTIPFANRFYKKEHWAVESTQSILYARLKQDLHNHGDSKSEYFELVNQNISEAFSKYDGINHTCGFRKLDKLRFFPIDSFSMMYEKRLKKRKRLYESLP